MAGMPIASPKVTPIGVEIEAVPASVRVAVAANKPEIEPPAPTGWWRKQRVRVQLLLTYNLLTAIAFGSLIGGCAVITYSSSDQVIHTSRSELKAQITDISKATLRETGQVLDARLDDGFSVLVQPTTFALFDILGSASTYDSSSVTSYTEPDKSYLKTPLTYDDRYQCISSTNDAVTGCSSATGLQPISLGASSLYSVGSTTTGDGTDAPNFADAGAVKDTTILDHYVKHIYAARPAWIDAFVSGLAGDPPSAPPLLRQYPGAVGDLRKDASNTRTYDPTTRSWYTDVTNAHSSLGSRTTEQYLAPWPMIISAPYLSDLGRGYLLSIMAPVAGPDGITKGVSGADILVSSLQALVTTIKSRETGEAFFLHRSTANVVASKQLTITSAMASIPTIDSLTLPGQTQYTFADLSGPSTRSSIVNDPDFVSSAEGTGSMSKTDPSGRAYELVWQDAWSSAYVLLTCTPEDEILRPIESQLDSIRSKSNRLFASSLTICLICMAVIICSAILLSIKMSQPVTKTVKQSDAIVNNIGGNLFNNIKVSGRRPDEKPTWRDSTNPLMGLLLQTPGEVGKLRGEFLRALFTLNKKRMRAVSPKSPLYHSGLPPSAPSAAPSLPTQYVQCLHQIRPEKTASAKARDEAALMAPTPRPLTMWNAIVSKIFCWLLLPTLVAMITVSMLTFNSVWDNVEDWMAPVRAKMVAEELTSLDMRAYERAQLASALIGAAAGSLQVLQGFATDLFDGALPHADARVTYSSPVSACPTVGSTEAAYFSCTDTQLSVSRGPRPSYSDNNYEAPVTYKPATTLPSEITTLQSGEPTPASVEPADATTPLTIPGALSAWVREQLLLSQLDQVLSHVFYSSKITYAYMGLHGTETYRQFPYQKLDSFTTGSPTCAAFPNQAISAFTPICRLWYQGALSTAKGTDVTYNRVQNDAVNVGQLFLPLSAAVRLTSGDNLVGVVVVDVALAELANAVGGWPSCYADQTCWSSSFGESPPSGINSSKLYDRGYTMMWDAQGYAIVHKSYAKDENKNKGAILVAELDSVGDQTFRRQFEIQMLDKGRVAGNWSYPWYNPEKGKDEVWHYSFLPVPGTPYMMALTVVADEVTEVADAAQERIQDNLRGAMGGATALICVLMATLCAFTFWINWRFARPLKKLLGLVHKWGDRDFTGAINHHDAANASSRELTELMSNFKKMLVALRFGETGWANGKQSFVMHNNFAALALVQESGNQRGLGVVMNNIALATTDTQVQDAFPQLDTGEIYGAAISIARQQVAAEPSNPALVDTLAFRLLNCTLWHMGANPPRPADASALLFELMKCCANPRTMATIAAKISCQELVSEPTILSAVTALLYAALDLLMQSPIEFDDAEILADLAVAHCDIGCTTENAGTAVVQFCQPPQLAMWALVNVPTIGERTRARLSLHAKMGADPSFVSFLDRACELDKLQGASGPVDMGSATAKWRAVSGQGASAPKAMMFVLDLSYSMDSDNRLPTCRTSLRNILTNHVEDADRAGLISFADDVRLEFALTKAGPVSGKMRQKMINTVLTLRTRGMTAFYQACFRGAQSLATSLRDEPTTPKWLVALTDGADNKSDRSSADECVRIIKSTPSLNVALITVGDDIDMRVCRRFLDAATEAGNTGLLVKANNQKEIAEAFETVSAAMSGGVAEVL